MRTTTSILLLTAVALTTLAAGCTVKDVDAPPLAGPSTFAHSFVMVADRDTLTQNGVDFTDIRITSLSPTGQSESVAFRAQIYVDGLEQDFGTLSTKSSITPATIRYTAPAASTLPTAQVPTTVTIAITPASAGDFRGEIYRQIDIRLVPQGIILPTNPNLVANFTVSPVGPQAFTTATFDASTTTNNGVACGFQCAYAWDFGDGTSGTGMSVTHQYRTFGNMAVTLTVTDLRGAQATRRLIVTVTAPTPPTVAVDVTPSSPVAGQDVFFSASRSTSSTGRALVSYEWNFGDGTTGTGVTTSHRYSSQGVFAGSLKVTDEVGATSTQTFSVTVGAGGPTVAFTFLPSAPRVNQTVTVNITATPTGATTIRSYAISWGDGSPVETSAGPTQSHNYGLPGQFVIAVTVTDSLGHTRTVTQAITIAP